MLVVNKLAVTLKSGDFVRMCVWHVEREIVLSFFPSLFSSAYSIFLKFKIKDWRNNNFFVPNNQTNDVKLLRINYVYKNAIGPKKRDKQTLKQRKTQTNLTSTRIGLGGFGF